LNLDVVRIEDTGKGAKSVADDLEAVLHKIEGWNQDEIAGYGFSYNRAQGIKHVEWSGQKARVL
jgi:hypothetical protein